MVIVSLVYLGKKPEVQNPLEAGEGSRELSAHLERTDSYFRVVFSITLFRSSYARDPSKRSEEGER